MKYIFLTQDFYDKYSNCPEIEQKTNRPYAMLLVEIDNVTWAIPLRSNISHKYVYWTNKDNKCGLDLSKAVVVENNSYISSTKAWIRDDEFKALRGKQFQVKTKMEKYIKDYVKAYERRDIDRNKKLCEYSTLQYFHQYIELLKDTDIGEVATN